MQSTVTMTRGLAVPETVPETVRPLGARAREATQVVSHVAR
ncbi:hypothetical protein [Nocardioides sp.]